MQKDDLIEKAGMVYAQSIWDAIPEDDKVIISFGMTPIKYDEDGRAYFEKMYKEQLSKHYECTVEQLEPYIVKEKLTRLSGLFSKGMAMQFMRLRKEEGKMVC